MKTITATFFALFIAVCAFASGPTNQEYKVDSKTSHLEWVGEKVTGSHEGTINIKEGTIVVKEGVIIGGNLLIDMSSIVISDIEDPETNGKLKGHLYSDDFFGVEKHPTSNLKITMVEAKGADNYHVHGELTIKGHTEKVEIPAIIKMEKNKLVAVGETEIDRTKFNIKYGSGSFFDNLGDKAIKNKFTVKFKVGAML